MSKNRLIAAQIINNCGLFDFSGTVFDTNLCVRYGAKLLASFKACLELEDGPELSASANFDDVISR